MTDNERELLDNIRKSWVYEINIKQFLFKVIDEQDAEIERLKADLEFECDFTKTQTMALQNRNAEIKRLHGFDGLPMGGPSEPGAKSSPYFTAQTQIKNLRAENERLKAPYNSVFECEACHALSRVSIERPVKVEK